MVHAALSLPYLLKAVLATAACVWVKDILALNGLSSMQALHCRATQCTAAPIVALNLALTERGK